ncbi:MAG: cyclic nucleotide-binding domain-containing protein [Alphaproteobacteria bacterium]|nr:MAG: cyclic nucleotide-binding domain-containing protein [Alphaproteobacteria bacterium]
MSLMEEAESLRKVPLFAKVEESHLKLLSFTAERVSFMDGETFIRQGDIGDHAFLILDGEVEILFETTEEARLFNVMRANQMVGEIALLRDSRRSASCRARGAVTCLRLSRDVFFHLIRHSPDFAIGIMKELAYRLDYGAEQVRDILRTQRSR